jgi:hypothetical protein
MHSLETTDTFLFRGPGKDSCSSVVHKVAPHPAAVSPRWSLTNSRWTRLPRNYLPNIPTHLIPHQIFTMTCQRTRNYLPNIPTHLILHQLFTMTCQRTRNYLKNISTHLIPHQIFTMTRQRTRNYLPNIPTHLIPHQIFTMTRQRIGGSGAL